MDALTPGPPTLRPAVGVNTDLLGSRSPCLRTSSLPIIPSPTTCRRPDAFLGFLRRAYRTTLPWPPVSRPVRHLGFASHSQARHDGRPNRVHFCYGLIVHLRLLSTPPRGDAVTFGYKVPEHPHRDSHPAVSMPLQAHECGGSPPLCISAALNGRGDGVAVHRNPSLGRATSPRADANYAKSLILHEVGAVPRRSRPRKDKQFHEQRSIAPGAAAAPARCRIFLSGEAGSQRPGPLRSVARRVRKSPPVPVIINVRGTPSLRI